MLLASVQKLEVLGGKCVLVTMGKRDGGGAAPYHGYITSQKSLLFSHWKILGAGKIFHQHQNEKEHKGWQRLFHGPNKHEENESYTPTKLNGNLIPRHTCTHPCENEENLGAVVEMQCL